MEKSTIWSQKMVRQLQEHLEKNTLKNELAYTG